MVIVEAKHIKKAAINAGFDICGVTSCQSFPINRAAFDIWLKNGYDSSLQYMRNNVDMRFDVGQMVEGARSVVVCGVSYKSEISGGYNSADKCKVASYACNRDYHKTLKKMLKAMLRELQTIHPSLEGRAFVDSAPILDKQYAVEAGLGWIGRQSLLVTPEYGTYVLLGELVLNAKVDKYDKPLERVGCGECRRCIDVCPTGAILPLALEQKRMTQLGHAVFHRGRCVVARDGVECGNCAEHCPADAIKLQRGVDGRMYPQIEKALCIGCGACENLCPATPKAIEVKGYKVHK